MEALKAGNDPKRAKLLNLDKNLPALYLANFRGKVLYSSQRGWGLGLVYLY
jgi:hypothetical protein